jgi:arginase
MIALVSAPSNLGLRPPQPTSVPGCAKAPEALREAGLFQRLAEVGATDAGVVLPGRYADDAARGGCAIRRASSSMPGGWPSASGRCGRPARPR